MREWIGKQQECYTSTEDFFFLLNSYDIQIENNYQLCTSTNKRVKFIN